MLAIVEESDQRILGVTTYRSDTEGQRLAMLRFRQLVVADIVDSGDTAEAEAEEFAKEHYSDPNAVTFDNRLTYLQGEFAGTAYGAKYTITLVTDVSNGHDVRLKKQFKVASISTNTGAFGHHGHILIARDGTVLEGNRHRGSGNVDLQPGHILEFICSPDGSPLNAHDHAFECLERLHGATPATQKLIDQVWAIEGELIAR